MAVWLEPESLVSPSWPYDEPVSSEPDTDLPTPVLPDEAMRPAPAAAPVLPVTGHSIPPGGVTPHELRNIEIRETFRGYHRDEVDALCERAAETIEHIERRRRDLEDRLRHVLEAPAGVLSSRTRPAATPARSPDTARDLDVVQRTVLLAQRAADETLAEAEARATRLVGEAETRAGALVAEAESTARRIADRERNRVAAEVAELETRRASLTADVDLLERFTGQYRDRIRHAIEAELERLGGSAVPNVVAPPRPVLPGESTTAGVLETGLAPEPALAPAPEPVPEPALDPGIDDAG